VQYKANLEVVDGERGQRYSCSTIEFAWPGFGTDDVGPGIEQGGNFRAFVFTQIELARGAAGSNILKPAPQ
jgi:hypothetical protein